jgi:hypothetical protein
MYLGAALVFGEERDQAVAALRNLVLADPRYRPDSLVFPPRVTGLFYEVLQTTKAVAVVAPRETRLLVGEGRFTARAYATSRHRIEARITSAKGDSVAMLHRGEVTDSVVIEWTGLDSAGSVVPAGQYTLVVTSSLAPDQILRSVHLPLQVTQQAVDTIPWPPPPSGTAGRWDLRVLVPSAVVGAGLIAPAVLGAGGAEGLRITLGIAVGAAGVIGGRKSASGPSPESEADWRVRVAAAREENRRRRSVPALVIRTGAPESREAPIE